MGIFAVPAHLSNPDRPEYGLELELIVDTGAVYTMLPAEVVERLHLDTPRERLVMLASGEQVTYRFGVVNIRLNGEDWPTLFLAGPARGSAAFRGLTRHAV